MRGFSFAVLAKAVSTFLLLGFGRVGFDFVKNLYYICKCNQEAKGAEDYKEGKMSNDIIVLQGEQISAYQLITLRAGLRLEVRTEGRMSLTSRANLKQVAESLAGTKFRTKKQALTWVEEACGNLGI